MSLILETLDSLAQECPDAPALTAPGHRALGFGALASTVEQTADHLDILLRGSRADGCVAVLLDNSAEWVITDLALVRLGRPSLPLPPFFTQAQRQHALSNAGAVGLILPHPTPNGMPLRVTGDDVGFVPLMTNAVALPPHTAKITYTSGSTASPKGVCLSQHQLEAVAASLVTVIGDDYAGLHVPILPMAVLLENVAGLYTNLLAGGCYHAAPLAAAGFERPFQPDIARLANLLAETRATSIILVPEILRALLAYMVHREFALPDLKLVAVGGARVSPRLLEAARKAGLPVYEGYGLSECGSVVALNAPGAHRPDRVGKVLPHLSVSIAKDGEIIVGPSPFLGYVGGALHDGPVSTGDLGEIDSNDFLRVTGRKTNTIINAFGRNISPEWVESELTAQPEIGQAIVFGEAQAALGAVITPSASGIEQSHIAAAVARTNAVLPEYARVTRWILAPPFSTENGFLTANGRLRRPTLLAAHADFVNAEG